MGFQTYVTQLKGVCIVIIDVGRWLQCLLDGFALTQINIDLLGHDYRNIW